MDMPTKALPSDSNFREDLIYAKMADLVKGQVIKLIYYILIFCRKQKKS